MGGHLFSPRFCPDLSVIHPCLGVETPVGGTTVPTSTTTKRYTLHALVVLKTSPPATRRSKVRWMLGFRMPRPSFGGSAGGAPGRLGPLGGSGGRGRRSPRLPQIPAWQSPVPGLFSSVLGASG